MLCSAGGSEKIRKRTASDLHAFLRAHAEIAKPAIMKHIKQLLLTRRHLPTGPVYEVSGSLELAPQDVRPVVARDGIGTPTAVDPT